MERTITISKREKKEFLTYGTLNTCIYLNVLNPIPYKVGEVLNVGTEMDLDMNLGLIEAEVTFAEDSKSGDQKISIKVKGN